MEGSPPGGPRLSGAEPSKEQGFVCPSLCDSSSLWETLFCLPGSPPSGHDAPPTRRPLRLLEIDIRRHRFRSDETLDHIAPRAVGHRAPRGILHRPIAGWWPHRAALLVVPSAEEMGLAALIEDKPVQATPVGEEDLEP